MNKLGQLILTACALTVASTSFALDCPKVKLACTVQTVDSAIIVSSETLFRGVNNDEPSLPADSCEAYLSMNSSTPNHKFVAALEGTDNITGYFYIGKDYGAMDPQFSTEMITGQKISLSYNSQTFSCELLSPDSSDQQD